MRVWWRGLRRVPGAWSHRAAKVVHTALEPPEITGGTSRRFMELGSRVRILVGLFALVAIPLAPGLEGSSGSVDAALIAFVYLPYAVLIRRMTLRSDRLPVRVAMIAGDTLVVFAFAVLVPETRTIALFGYMLLVAFHTFIGGMPSGLTVGAAALALGFTAELTAAERAHEPYTLVMYGAVLIALSAIVTVAMAERRRTARFLARLHTAVVSLPVRPGLEETVDAVCANARRAVDAKFCSVIVRDGGTLSQGALEGDLTGAEGVDPKERSAQMIDRILEHPDASPSGLALLTGEPVVVRDVAEDPRFSHWSDEARRQQFTSTVAVPVRTGDGTIGVIAAYLVDPSEANQETVDLLMAYADQVTTVILRAFAYEHERRAAMRLAETDQIKSDLVATVSHELRTPLTSVKGFVETLARRWEHFDDAERLALLERVLRNTDVLAGLVDQVLDYSRLEAGAVSLGVEARSVSDEVAAGVESSAALLDRHDVVVDVPEDLFARLDSTAVEHVLSNLLSNAAKYSPEGSTIAVTARAVDGEVVVSVADEGPGISEGDRERVFDRFYRGERTPGPRGTGIGLAIVARYVELMGGRVWVESTVGEGSTFSFALTRTPRPIAAERGAPADATDDASTPAR